MTDSIGQVCDCTRLVDNGVAAGINSSRSQFWSDARSGDQHRTQRGKGALQPADDFDSSHIGKHLINHEDIGLQLHNPVYRLLSRCTDGDDVYVRLFGQQARDALSHHRMVVDKNDLDAFFRLVACRWHEVAPSPRAL